MTLRLAGVPISDDDVHTLLDLLMRKGRAEDIFAATVIRAAHAKGSALLALTRGERMAILGVLDEPTEGLAELRGVLRDLGR